MDFKLYHQGHVLGMILAILANVKAPVIENTHIWPLLQVYQRWCKLVFGGNTKTPKMISLEWVDDWQVGAEVPIIMSCTTTQSPNRDDIKDKINEARCEWLNLVAGFSTRPRGVRVRSVAHPGDCAEVEGMGALLL